MLGILAAMVLAHESSAAFTCGTALLSVTEGAAWRGIVVARDRVVGPAVADGNVIVVVLPELLPSLTTLTACVAMDTGPTNPYATVTVMAALATPAFISKLSPRCPVQNQ